MRLTVLSFAAVMAAACGGGEEVTVEEQQQALRAARADSVAQAEAVYDPAVYDTISWENDGERWERGGVVWSFTCQRCHGADGKGQGADAVGFDIEVPDLTSADWELAGDVEAIRHVIFVGHDSEMPSMGIVGLSYKDTDAAAHYINDLLLPRE
jgi:cytochrome c